MEKFDNGTLLFEAKVTSLEGEKYVSLDTYISHMIKAHNEKIALKERNEEILKESKRYEDLAGKLADPVVQVGNENKQLLLKNKTLISEVSSTRELIQQVETRYDELEASNNRIIGELNNTKNKVTKIRKDCYDLNAIRNKILADNKLRNNQLNVDFNSLLSDVSEVEDFLQDLKANKLNGFTGELSKAAVNTKNAISIIRENLANPHHGNVSLNNGATKSKVDTYEIDNTEYEEIEALKLRIIELEASKLIEIETLKKEYQDLETLRNALVEAFEEKDAKLNKDFYDISNKLGDVFDSLDQMESCNLHEIATQVKSAKETIQEINEIVSNNFNDEEYVDD